MTSTGLATLTTAGPRAKLSRRLEASAIESLLHAVREARYADLGPRQGTCYVDMTMRDLTVRVDGPQKTVTLCVIEAETLSPDERAEALRALRVWIAVRRLFPEQFPGSAHDEVKALLAEPLSHE